MVGSLLKGRRLWREGFLLSPQRCKCCPFRSAYQGRQHEDVQVSNNMRASLPGYKGAVEQNGGLLYASSHHLRLLDTLLLDVCISDKTLGSCSGGQCFDKNTTTECCKSGGFTCYPHPLKLSTASYAAAFTSSNALGKTSSKNSVFATSSSATYSSSFANSLPQSRRIFMGLRSWRTRNPPCIGSRSFFSTGNNETLSDHDVQALEDSVSDAIASSSESDEDFDFRNFPALKSSHYQDYERPSEMQVKRRVTWQTSRSRKLFNTGAELTVESIPKPKGRTYDFGLGDMLSKPPPLEAGARPQGGFDTNISLDECEEAPSEAPLSSVIFTPRIPSRNLPWDAPEADNQSDISADPQKHEDSVRTPESDFSWDPYDF